MPVLAADSAAITRAAATLRAGGLVAFPTETVYGLGADASRDDAVAKVFAVKGRPRAHPLIAHLIREDERDSLPALRVRDRSVGAVCHEGRTDGYALAAIVAKEAPLRERLDRCELDGRVAA